MSILIYAESAEGKFKKVAFELASYAKKVAESLGTSVTAVTINAADTSELGKYGVDKVLKVSNDKLNNFNAKAYADVVKQAAEKESAKVIVLSSTTDSLYLAPLVAINLKCRICFECSCITIKYITFSSKKKCFFKQSFQYYSNRYRCKSFSDR